MRVQRSGRTKDEGTLTHPMIVMGARGSLRGGGRLECGTSRARDCPRIGGVNHGLHPSPLKERQT